MCVVHRYTAAVSLLSLVTVAALISSGAAAPETEVEPGEDAPTPASPEPEPEYEGFIEQPKVEPGGGKKRHLHLKDRSQPPVYGPLLVAGGLGVGPNAFGLRLGLTRFVVPYVGLGGIIADTVIFDSPVTFNEFVLAPQVWLIALPYRRVTPYVRGSIGLEAYSHKLGVYALSPVPSSSLPAR